MAWDSQLFEGATNSAWEYQVLDWTTGSADSPERLKPVLASMGGDGWELVTVVASVSGKADELTLFFKRARPGAPSFVR